MADEDPVCVYCSKPITGDILNYGGKPYHVNHLLCTKCNTSLGAGVSIKNLGGKPHCGACWTAVMYGGASAGAPAKAAKAAPAPAPAPAPVKSVVSQPVLVTAAPSSAPAPAPVAAPTAAPAPAPVAAPTAAAVQTHNQIAEQIKQGAAPALKHTEVAHDASAPKVEATVHIKPNPHPAVMADVQKGAPLKHTEVAHDASKPQIASNVTVQKNERQNLFKEIQGTVHPSSVAAGAGSDVVKTLEDALKAAETSLRMIDATKKTVANNEKNLEDSKNNAHGCDPIPEAEKKLAASKDLLQAHLETAAKRLKTAAYCFEQAKRVAHEPVKERYSKLLASAQAHGL